MDTQERIEMLEQRLSRLREEEAVVSPMLTKLSDEMDRLLDLLNDDKVIDSLPRIMEINRQYAMVKHQYNNLEEDAGDLFKAIYDTEGELEGQRAQLEWEESQDEDR